MMAGHGADAVGGPARHIPVLLDEVLAALAPAAGDLVVDGTFGAGGYTRAILDSGASVLAIDRDPDAIEAGRALEREADGRLRLVQAPFSELDAHVATADGVVLDIGVSSMQIDQAERGFSFQRNGPLDMRMGQAGPTAADAVNHLPADDLSRIIHIFGEEPKARAIARAIVAARGEKPITTTAELVAAIERATGRQRPQDRIHPATRTFQALRIHVNGELDELVAALHAAEEVLRPGGRLVVVTFHSLEDRIVKRFLTARAGKLPAASRHVPETTLGPAPSFTLAYKGHLGASPAEAHANPRARSAKMRVGVRTAAPPMPDMTGEILVSATAGGRH